MNGIMDELGWPSPCQSCCPDESHGNQNPCLGKDPRLGRVTTHTPRRFPGTVLAIPQLPRRSLHIRRKTPRLNTHRFTTFVALVISCWKSECRLSSSFLFLPIQDFWYSVSREY